MEKSQDRLAEAERKGKHPASNQAWKSKLYGGSHFVAGKLLHASPRQSAAAPSRSPQAPTALEDGRTPPTWAAHGRENPPVRKARRVRARQPTDHPASLRHAGERPTSRFVGGGRSRRESAVRTGRGQRRSPVALHAVPAGNKKRGGRHCGAQLLTDQPDVVLAAGEIEPRRNGFSRLSLF
ncbi:Hypothetical predicted protein [Podarcis lilfordi]|uniref:Uncharacterized protein n=1 Tax=Podarcis lilfordi TaxID=74358 RepID=A0AA35KPQ8_9SAUR|nr:Hypothetical predicted protein [Podarcis lilfordi]